MYCPITEDDTNKTLLIPIKLQDDKQMRKFTQNNGVNMVFFSHQVCEHRFGLAEKFIPLYQH